MEKRNNIKARVVYFSFLLFLVFSLSITFAAELNLTYDNNGNLITGDRKYRTYNEFNQLIKIQINNSNGTVLEKYIYHPVEDRILAKNVYDENGDIKETVIYVNDNLVRTSIYPTANIINTSDKIYVKDENGLVAEFNPNQSKIFYYNDHLGSTGILTNGSGTILEQTFYEPFGGIISGGNVSHFYYEGKDFSQTTGEYDFNFRKYNPELLIFTKPDSGVSNVYDPQLLNRYSFERNNPYKYVDPDGNIPVTIIAGGVAGLVVGGIQGYLTYKETGGDLTKAVVSGLISGGATFASVATLGAASTTSAIAGGTALRYVGTKGASRLITGTTLAGIGAGESIAQQTIVRGGEFSYADMGISAGANVFGRRTAELLGLPFIVSRTSGQFFPSTLSRAFGKEVLSETSSAFYSFTGSKAASSYLPNNQLFTPLSVLFTHQSSSNGGSGGRRGSGGRVSEPNYGVIDRLRGCGKIMSCSI